MNNRYKAALGGLLLFGAAACADLVVDNTNTPDRRRALATAGDVEALVAGGYKSWFGGEEWQQGTTAGSPGFWLGTASFMWSSTAANQGSHEYSQIPRVPLQNTATHQEYVFIATSWQRHYRALASVADGLRTIGSDTAVSNALGASRVLRARIFGKFVQGLAHGSLALIYDKGYIVDEGVQTIDPNGAPVDLGEPIPYTALNAAALAKLDSAIALAGTAGSTTIPKEWMGTPADVNMTDLIRIANSFKARYRANVARTPEQRAAVNWTAVLAEVGAGIRTNFNADRAVVFSAWCNQCTLQYMQSPTFQQLTYFIHGMADQSGNYQAWLQRPLADRGPNFADNSPVLIVTPDLRFPQGTTLTQQAANKGKYYHIRLNAAGAPAAAPQWTNPNRGQWRHSWYSSLLLDPNKFLSGPWPEISYAEMRLLAAEAHFRMGNLGAAADSVNVSRTANGLNATDATGLNTSCVPKLPSGACGGLFEMLKWEKRNETWGTGAYKASWYFDGRGWGDLYKGTPLQLPIPEEQHIVLGLGPAYTFGGVGGPSSSPGTSYGFPGE